MAQTASPHPLRKWRLDERLTLDAAGQKVGATRMAWSDWERGNRIPNRDFMPKICALTGLSSNVFYDRASAERDAA